MKKLLTGAAMLAVLGFSGASAQDGGVYIGGQLGGNWVANDSSDFDFADLGGIEYEGGVMLGAMIGYEVMPSLALELEGTWRHNQYEVLEQDDEGSVTAIMANAVYRAAIDDTTTMYFGAGIGFADASMDDLFVAGGDVDLDPEGDFAYQIKLGFDYELDSGNSFGIGIGYFETDIEVDDDVFTAVGVIGDEFEVDYGAFNGFITYKFGM